MTDEKTELQKLSEKILIKKQHASITHGDEGVAEFAEEYRQFISENKTEREVIKAIRSEAEKQGFVDLRKVTSVESNGKYLVEIHNKNLALITFNGFKQVKVLASHVDSPCLHLKPYPLQESNNAALLKTHYYGGIKKYQWLNMPLALKGVAFTQSGERVDISLGEKPDEPVLTIPDLLPHLARDQMTKTMKEGVSGEQLNAIIATLPVDDEKISEKVKLKAAKLLYEKYGLVEQDLISAELRLVPAGQARYVGLDKSLMAGYGHDDRSSAYTSLQAHLDTKGADSTQITLFYDKEEIGSNGTTGAQNTFLTALIEDLIDLSESNLRALQVYSKMQVLSCDVTAGINPNFSDVHDPSNANMLGFGVALEKFGGAGGKYSSQDANTEFTHFLTILFDENQVKWQSGELGKIDIGGGGTIAKFLAQQGADVIDMGVPVLGMHAPYELLSTHDLYHAYKAMKVFLQS